MLGYSDYHFAVVTQALPTKQKLTRSNEGTEDERWLARSSAGAAKRRERPESE
jgi:hypothetical protein